MLWTQLEAFARAVHGSLNPTEVSYITANEGRRLIDCDRVSVGVRDARKVKVEAVSGADVVERRSNLVQLMRKLFDRVIAWGEKLVYTGTKDEGLPPSVLAALDAYLAESNSKVLVVLPLKDERDKDTKRLPRSAMMMECFEPQQTPEQLVARLEVVGKHAAPALYNAVEHRRIPMRMVWAPLAKVQEGLGGKVLRHHDDHRRQPGAGDRDHVRCALRTEDGRHRQTVAGRANLHLCAIQRVCRRCCHPRR